MEYSIDKILKELKLQRDIAFKQIDENPFLRKDWTFLDKLFAKIFNYELPLPDAKRHKLRIQEMYEDNKKTVENYMRQVKAIEAK